MSSPDPAKIIFSTRFGYFLNDSDYDGSVVLSAASIGAGDYRAYSLSIPIDNQNAYSQIKVNFSHDPNDWYTVPVGADIVLDANFNIAITSSYAGSALTLTFYVVKQTGGTHTSTATTATARVLLFEPPN